MYVPRLNFKKTMISGACTNNGSKIKLSTNKEHITFPWIWGLTGYHFCTEKELNKIYLRLIINKYYQWILTCGLLKYLLPSKLLFFSYMYVPLFFLNLYFIYLYRCYSYIFCFHFKGWPKRRIIHIASSVVLQNSENVRCKQYFLYFESHKKSLKQLHIIVCFSVLSISSAFTISTYFIN
jgi:hypothetical protein